MGHIVVMDDSPAQLALTSYSQGLWRELSSRLPASAEYESCGTLWVASDDEEMEEVHRKRALYATVGIASEVLDSHALAEAEPHLSPALAGALLVPSDGVLYPPCAAEYLVNDAVRLGAKLYSQFKVVSAGDGLVRLNDGTELRAPRIINALGSEAVTLLPDLPIRKRKGHLVITDRYPGFVHHQVVELGYLKSAHSIATDSVAFNIQPRKTGQVLLGSSRQFGAEDSTVDYSMVAALIDRARVFMPEIGTLSAIRIWTGFRAATPDKLPLIGPWQDDPTLFLAAGHEGLGITTSLGTAKVLVNYLVDGETQIPIDPYLPKRFVRSEAHA
jgi:glycine/D-amino acid oxidase-like deaminating enzyme